MSAARVWLTCPACGSDKSAGFERGVSGGTCRTCRRDVQALVFPRAFAPSPPPLLPNASPVPGDAVCFYDPTQKATGLCSQCGALIGDAWSAMWGSQCVCMRCLDKLRASGRDSRFESSRWMWDNICLLLALAMFNPVMPYVAVVTAPAALVLGIRSWNRPRSMVPRSRLRLVFALVLAVLQILGMLIALFFITQALLSK